MGLKLLHISDIHFQYFKDHQFLDLDKDIQNEIELDLQDLKKEYGKINIILIGGDIAFSGKEEEYQIADNWIKKICKITGCEEVNVLTVPGNHDIERGKVSIMVKDAHRHFKALRKRNEIDTRIADYVSSTESIEFLLGPLTNYNEFAQKYDSIPEADNLLFWEKDFSLDNSILRIRGVNSAIVSDETDDQRTSKLVLGSHQSSLVRAKGVINVVLCHHPPDWLIDGEDVYVDLKARARLHLFGHKHVFAAELIDNTCLTLAAGAMQPSRNESGWEPRYNIIELAIPMLLEKPTLNIKLFKRVWNKNKKKFTADFGERGNIFEEYNMELTEYEISNKIDKSNETITDLKITPMAEAVIDVNAPNPQRQLAYMFLGLPYHLKLKIAVDLGLIDESDRDLGEIQKAQAYFKRASDRNLLFDLWNKVVKATGNTLSNPFTK